MKLESLVYPLGRLAAITCRPILLYFLIKIDNNLSNSLGLIFLALVVAMFISAFDSGRFLYESSHSIANISALQYYKYFGRLSSAILIAAPALLSMSYFYKININFIYLFTYFCTERLIEETLRFNLFSCNFVKWGLINILRFIMILFFVIVLLLYKSSEFIYPNYIVIYLLLSNLITFTIFYPKTFLFIIKSISSSLFWKINMKRQCRFLFFNKSMFLAVIISGIFGYIDKFIFSIFEQEKISIILITISIFQIAASYYDFFYFSLNRRLFMDVRDNTYSFIFNRKSIRALVVGNLIAISIYLVFIVMNQNYILSIYLILMIAMLQNINIISGMLREVMHYRSQQHWILSVDSAILFTLIAYSLYSKFSNNDLMYYLFVLLSILIARFFAFFFLIAGSVRIEVGNENKDIV